jgi:uncharacterized membrane-anchored protein
MGGLVGAIDNGEGTSTEGAIVGGAAAGGAVVGASVELSRTTAEFNVGVNVGAVVRASERAGEATEGSVGDGCRSSVYSDSVVASSDREISNMAVNKNAEARRKIMQQTDFRLLMTLTLPCFSSTSIDFGSIVLTTSLATGCRRSDRSSVIADKSSSLS